MDLSTDERAVMHRFAEKTHIAGGARVGYVLRRVALEQGQESDFDLDGALGALVEKGLVLANESGDFVFLTEDGVTALGPRAGT